MASPRLGTFDVCELAEGPARHVRLDEVWKLMSDVHDDLLHDRKDRIAVDVGVFVWQL